MRMKPSAFAMSLPLALLAGCTSFAPGQAPTSMFDAPAVPGNLIRPTPPPAAPADAPRVPAVLMADLPLATPTPSAAPTARPTPIPSGAPTSAPVAGVPHHGSSSGGFITDHGGGFVTDHGAALTGVITAPSAALIAALAADVAAGRLDGLSKNSPFVTDHGGGFVTDHGAGFVTDHGGAYRLLDHDGPLVDATVEAVDAEGHVIASAVRTDAAGRYSLPIATPPGGILFVRAKTTGTHPLTLIAAVEAEEGDALTANVDSATTLVGKKLATMAAMGAVPLADVKPEAADRVGDAVGEVLTARGMAAATMLDGYDTAVAFDRMLTEDPALKADIAAIVAEVGGADFTGPTPPRTGPPTAPPGILATRVGAEIRLSWQNLDVTTPVNGHAPDKLKIYIKAGWSPWFSLRDVDDATGDGAFTLPPGDYTFAVKALAGADEGPDQAESRVVDTP